MSALSPGQPAGGGGPQAPQADKPYTASTASIHAWGASGISAYWMWKEFALIQMLFTMGYGMDTRLIGWVYALPRFFDAAIDPFIGHLSDNFKSRWGRRRPFMFFSCIGGAILVPAMYLMSPDWGDWGQFFYMLPVVLLFYAIWGTYETTRTALGYELSDDYSQRSRIQAIGSAWFTLPSLIGSMTFAVVVQLSTGGTWSIGIPAFRVPWLLGLFFWFAGAVGLAAVIGFLAMNQRSRRSQWKAAFATVILALVLVPAASFAMHGAEGTRAMFHSWNPSQRAAAASGPGCHGPTSAEDRAESRSTVLLEDSQGHGTVASTLPAQAGAVAWGLDYPGFLFFSIHFPNLGGGSKYPVVPAARIASLICCGLILLFGLIPTFLVRERFTASNRKHVSVWKALLATSRNRPFLVIIILRIAETLGTSLWAGLSMYVGIYYVCRGDKVQYSMISTFGMALVGFLFAMLVWPLAAPLTRKIGKRWGIVLCYGASLVSAGITPFIYHPGWIWVIFLVGIGFVFIGQVKGMFLNSLMPDICDIDELISGERREGLYSAVLQFINKIESSLVGLLAMYVLAWTGFDSKLASQNVMPGEDVLIRMLWYGFIPMLVFAVVAFVITFYLPLTPGVMAKVHAQLEQRRDKAKVRV